LKETDTKGNMELGIIGAGQIGSVPTRHFTRLGHNVVVANSRAPETLTDLAKEIGYTMVRATQFFEFVGSIDQFATEGSTVRVPSVLMQPMATDDVAAALTRVVLGEPTNGTVEIAGPDQIRQDELVRQVSKRNRRCTEADY
jgi:predicted dinucleotide-binding enzyme